MRRVPLCLVLAALLGVLPPASSHADEEVQARASVSLSVAGLKVRPVPSALRGAKRGFRNFYERYTTLEGFTIQASQGPRDEALLEAAWIIRNMLAKRRDLLDTLRWRGIRLSVMAHDEWTTEIPEHAALTPAKWWDYRARGLGPGPRRPVVTCAEENLLAFDGDPYAGESILIHEFGHAIDLEALRYLDRHFAGKLEAAYKSAMAAGLWKDCYAATNKEEYWAEGVQSWFDANGGARSLPNGVETREALLAHDPRLGALLREVFGRNPWRYTPPATRVGRGHLRGYKPEAAPIFRWPQGLADWYWAYEKKKASGEGLLALAQLPAASAPTRSPVTTSETRVLFVNECGVDVRIFWLGYDGKRKPYGTLRAGAADERASLAFHIWVVTDDGGRELGRFRAGKTAGRAVIRAPDATK